RTTSNQTPFPSSSASQTSAPTSPRSVAPQTSPGRPRSPPPRASSPKGRLSTSSKEAKEKSKDVPPRHSKLSVSHSAPGCDGNFLRNLLSYRFVYLSAEKRSNSTNRFRLSHLPKKNCEHPLRQSTMILKVSSKSLPWGLADPRPLKLLNRMGMIYREH